VQYTRLGSSGLKISRIALGMMSYGDPGAVSWFLPEDKAEPIVRRAVDAGVTLFDTADMYSAGASETITGRLLAELFGQRSDYVLATKLFYPMGSGPNDRGLSANTSCRPLTPHCGGSPPTTSTCTRSTGGTSKRPSKRPYKPWTIWYTPAKSGTSAHR
jgi:aryl-alcohol dehydrogenase-like predicted oxidoreductase